MERQHNDERQMVRTKIAATVIAALTTPLWLAAQGKAAEVIEQIERANSYWQSNNIAETNAFWDNAAYHTGNIEAYKLTGREDFLDYSLRWARHNRWQGATQTDTAKWKYRTYGEGQDHVLFGDWQICFQTYIDLYWITKELGADDADTDIMTVRAREVMGYEVHSAATDYWWWADALYMVMPVMTKMYQLTGDEIYLDKLYANILFTDSIMLDVETGLYYRDGKYVYPKHKSLNGQKDFWARGDGWVLAGLAKVLSVMPADNSHYEFFKDKYLRLAKAVIGFQQPDGYWTRSMADAAHAPGPETSGTAFFCYGLAWGLNNGLLREKAAVEAVENAWRYLSQTALQKDGRVGYVQPIGEKAIAGQVVDTRSQANFGVGAFLLAACEYHRFIK